MALRTTLSEVSARRFLVTSPKARVRVRGSAYGILRVGSDKRWVGGEFDETFVIDGAPFEVEVFGFGGRIRRRIDVLAEVSMSPPRVTLCATRPKVTVAKTPWQHRALGVAPFRAPRPRGLRSHQAKDRQ